MRLIKLEANKGGFKTVHFNREGLTLIVGKQAVPEESRSGKTYNGVGKSLVIRLVHFLLGSDKIEEFEKKLPGWEFSLTIELGDQTYKITRSTGVQGSFTINDQEMTTNEFRKWIEPQVFEVEPGLSLTFRSLICRFIRPAKASYNKAEVFITEETDYNRLINNAFLMGLDPHLIKRKRDLRAQYEETRKLKANFDKDPILHDFYVGVKDADIELQDLEEQIEKLDQNLKKFDVAEDYHNIRKQADEASRQIREIENRAVVIQNAIVNIDESVRSRPDIPREKVISVYEEAKFELGEKVRKSLDEVLDFHAALFANRRKRLLEEKKRLKAELEKSGKKRKEQGKVLEDSLKYLNTHRALDEFVALTNKLKDLETRARKIQDYKNLIRQYDVRLQETNIEMNKQNILAQTYLDEQATMLKENVAAFRSLAKEFYPDKSAGISVTNNTGDNQLRFDVHSKIQDDASDGINEVKIFCFDLTLLLARRGHKIDFLFHDSRLFNMDPRQRETLFKLVDSFTKEHGFQYIASINQDQLASMKDTWTQEEYDEIIDSRVTTELTDESAEGKLLGIEVDMDYDQ